MLNQTTFNNDVDTIQLRMTPEFLSLIKRHCSGAIDVSISALLDYGIKKILDENISISIQQIEKEIVIEKVPDDYEATKNLNSDLLNKNRHLNYDNENLQRVIKIKEHELKRLEDDSYEAITLKETIESLRTDKEKLEGTYKNAMELSSLLTEFENFFDEKMAPLRFKAVIAGLGTDFQLKKLRDMLTLVDSWLTEMNKVVPDEGRKIIEGEIING